MADKEAARKSGRPIVVSLTPDVCMTPKNRLYYRALPSTDYPSSVSTGVMSTRWYGGSVPYPVTADLSEALNASPNVNFGRQTDLYPPHVVGDEAGSGGAKCEPMQGLSTVRVDGQPVARHGDHVYHEQRQHYRQAGLFQRRWRSTLRL